MENLQELYNDGKIATVVEIDDLIYFVQDGLDKVMQASKFRDQLRGFRVLTAKVTQTGAGAPVVTSLEDTITGIVWTRSSGGIYYGTKTGAFLIDHVWLSIAGTYGFTTSIERISDDVIRIKTGGDSQLTDASFEIRVYDTPLT